MSENAWKLICTEYHGNDSGALCAFGGLTPVSSTRLVVNAAAVDERNCKKQGFHLQIGAALTALFITRQFDMSLVLRKPVLGVSDQVLQKPVCTTTEDG